MARLRRVDLGPPVSSVIMVGAAVVSAAGAMVAA
jgi:hypothetical protein